MKLFNFGRARSQRSASEKVDLSPTSEFWYNAIGAATSAGQVVTPDTASRIAAVFACKTAITESIAMLPIVIKEQVDERRTKNRSDHRLFELLHDAPNGFQDSFEFFEVAETSALDHGDFFAFIERSKTGEILSLVPLQAPRMKVNVLEGNRLGYEYRTGSTTKNYTDQDIFHFKPFSKDGIRGRTPIAVCADVVGFSLALQQHGNKTFENGAFLSGFLKASFAFKDDNHRTTFMESFKKVISSKNSGKMGLLESGVEFVPYSMKNDEAQFLESRQFSVVEIARLFRMPPHMIQDLSQGASYSSIEQQSINFVTYTIQPWLTRWERAIKRQLLANESKTLFPKFNERALLRGDLKSRTEALVLQLQNGLKTINEARNIEDDNPISDAIGDQIFISHNSIPADQVGKPKTEEPVAKEPEQKSRSLDLDKLKPIVREILVSAATREKTEAKKLSGKEDKDARFEVFIQSQRSKLEQKLKPVAALITDEPEDGLRSFLDWYEAELRCEFFEVLASRAEQPKERDLYATAEFFVDFF